MDHRDHDTSACPVDTKSRATDVSRRRTLLCALVIALILSCSSVQAVIQNEQIGFSPNHVFDGSLNVENIDIMTGNVNLSIPLGQRYMLNDWFGYQVMLHYNARIWKHKCDHLAYPPVGCPGKLLNRNTYGLGFQIHFGRIYHDPDDKVGVYRYQTSSGGEHFFCDFPEGDCGDYKEFTTDTSHLLIRPLDGGSGTPEGVNSFVMYPGDGTKVTFGHRIGDYGGFPEEWYATRIETSETYQGEPHAVTITYQPGSAAIDAITDTAGRTIDFDNGDIIFPAFDGTDAVYTLVYDQVDVTDPSDKYNSESNYPPVSRTVLKELQLPELNPATESYRFDTYNPWGSLTSWRLPSGARIDYNYTAYKSGNGRPFHISMYSKELFLTGQPTHTWTYNRFGDSVIQSVDEYFEYVVDPPQFPGLGSNPNKVEVTDPFGNLTVYWFSSSVSDCDLGGCASKWNDGLLWKIDQYAGPDEVGSRLARTTKHTYEYDEAYFEFGTAYTTKTHANSVPINVRLVETETITPAGAGQADRSHRTVYSDWGHEFPSGFGFQEWPLARRVQEYDDEELYREVFTLWGSPYGFAYREVRNSQGQVLASTDRAYVNNTLRIKCEVRRRGPGVADLTYGIFLSDSCDQNDPELALTDDDVATVNTYDAAGSLESKRVFGLGDNGESITSYQHVQGVLSRAGYEDPAIDWYSVNRVIEPSTGLVAQSTDPAGAYTNYDWDDLGRLLSVSPRSPELPIIVDYSAGVSATTVQQYRNATDYTETVYHYDELGRLVEEQRRNATGDVDFRRTEFDIAGRVTRRSEWTGSGEEPVWTEFEYTRENPNPGPGEPAAFSDPLGRISRVTRPGGGITETQYEGLSTTVTVYGIQGESGPVNASTTYTHDIFGRLIAVDSPGSNADAQYAYDEFDNLVEVRLNGESQDPGKLDDVQIRRFGYDSMGRLLYATNPESGTVEYLAYDARGNLLEYRDAQLNTFKHTYDAAGRLTAKSVVVGGADQVLVLNTYDSASGAGPAAGKLTQQESFRIDNGTSSLVSTLKIGYGPTDSPTSCEGTYYRGLNGRPSWQSRSIEPWSQELTTEFCYDDMGATALVEYPDFASSGRTRTRLEHSYTNGAVSRVSDLGRQDVDYATSIEYHPTGAFTAFTRGSGVVNTVSRDDLGRPESFTVSMPNQAPIWGTGTYAYDQAGNVIAIGIGLNGMSSTYGYDELSRLNSAVISHSSPVTTFDLSYAYDPFGNMIQRNKQVNANPTEETVFTVDPNTNRMQGVQVGSGNPTLPFHYDPNGNLDSDGSQGYEFDAQNRLFEVWDQEEGALLAAYAYDADGYRVRSVTDGIETFFFRDAGGQVLSEFRRAAGQTAEPVWDKDYVYALGQPVAVVKNELPSELAKPWATNVSGNSVTVNWEASPDPDIDTYIVKRESDSPGVFPFIFMVDASETSVVDDLTGVAGSAFTYSLWSWDSASNVGPTSPPLVVRPRDGQPPPVPTGLVAEEFDGAVRLTWDPITGVDDFHGYSVSRRRVPVTAPWETLGGPEQGNASRMDYDVLNGARYRYRIYAVDTSGNYSEPSEVCRPAPDYVKPHDSYPPARPQSVQAYPGTANGEVLLRWQGVLDSDLSGYMIFRSTDATELGSYLCVEPPYYGDEWCESAKKVAKTYIDTGLTAGVDYYYTVFSYDESGNLSLESQVVVGNAPDPGLAAPVLSSVAWEVDEMADPIDWESFPDNNCFVHLQNDDRVGVRLSWSGVEEPTNDVYRIYRYSGSVGGPGALPFTAIAEVPIHAPGGEGTSYEYFDESLNGAAYSYYVVRASSSSQSAASNVLSATDVFGGDPPAQVWNLRAVDGRDQFESDNSRSRRVTVRWSRVPEQQLVGYHVYRRCEWEGANNSLWASMDIPECVHSWTRLTSTPVGEIRTFEDNPGGLNGAYIYAVRPVGPNFEEGPIYKALGVEVNFLGYDPPPCDDLSEETPCQCWADTLTEDIETKAEIDTHSVELARVNAIQRGTGDPVGDPATPSVDSVEYREVHLLSGIDSHTLRWTANAERDLAGYHVEMAGAAGGPWRRLTTKPVAWWETSFDVKGVSYRRWDAVAEEYVSYGPGRCAHYRLFAVDEYGNESPAISPLIYDDEGCGANTPAAPTNVVVSTSTPAVYSVCNNRIEWDEVSEADAYYVYRYVIRNTQHANEWDHFFYQTAALSAGTACSGGTCSFVETGADYGPDCHWNSTGEDCEVHSQEAYYVTASKNGGGESPRSEIVFWNCNPATGPEGNAYAIPDSRFPWSDGNGAALASAAEPAEPGVCPDLVEGQLDRHPNSSELNVVERASKLRRREIAPLLTLGTVDPPYQILDLHLDHLGSVRAITDQSGAIVSSHDFFPFGEELTPIADAYNKKMFTGHERDKTTGTDYMLARYYGANVGRFLSTDPFGGATHDPQSWNRYTYAFNDPLSFADPDGRSAVGKIVKLGVRGMRVVAKELDFQDTVRAVQDGENVITKNRRLAREVGEAAGDGRPVHHSAHSSAGEGARPHYHPDVPGAKPHIFYSAASALTLEHYAQDQGGLVRGGAFVGDLFNPLSLPKDLFDIWSEGKGLWNDLFGSDDDESEMAKWIREHGDEKLIEWDLYNHELREKKPWQRPAGPPPPNWQ